METIFAILTVIVYILLRPCGPCGPHNLRLPLDGIHTDQARFKNISGTL